MKKKEFLQHIADLSAELRANIEAEFTGWDDSPEAIAERRKKVFDSKNGYKYFCQNYFPHYTRHCEPSKLHEYLFSLIPLILQDPDPCNDALAAPRGEAKSVLGSQFTPLYCVVTAEKKNIPIISSTFEIAVDLLEGIKAELDSNPRIKIDFPECYGAGRTWQAGTIITTNNIKIKAFGAGKKLRGTRFGAYRPDLIILDDIENDENVRKPEQRQKLEDWLNKAVLPMVGAGEKGDVLYVGTILHYDSVLSRVLKNSMWRSKVFRAFIKWPTNMNLWERWEELLRSCSKTGKSIARKFYYDNQAEMDEGAICSWSARPPLTLMEIRARDGHSTFDSEYQNEPINSEDSLFQGAITYWSELPNDLIYFGSVDPSLGKNGGRGDPSALLVGGYQRSTGKLYVVEAQIRRRAPDKIISDVITLHKEYSCHMWFVETVQFQSFLKDELVKRSAQQQIPVPARDVTPSTDKVLRIESLQPHVANGLIVLNVNQSTLISQLSHFPMADHDDGPDALHMLWAGAVSNSAPVEWTPADNERDSACDDNDDFGTSRWRD
ncbi:MAG: phage terminase large subunit [Gammaproteobacteria bacterium]|nr:phage terminase large subunit [Gammaproteobacteria bacterium]